MYSSLIWHKKNEEMKEEEEGGETQQEMNELSFMQAFSGWSTLGGEHWTKGSLPADTH